MVDGCVAVVEEVDVRCGCNDDDDDDGFVPAKSENDISLSLSPIIFDLWIDNDGWWMILMTNDEPIDDSTKLETY